MDNDKNSDQKRLLIVGGIAGGASCAARARRLSETAEIILFERGPHVSLATCGLPYYVGDVIKGEDNLLVATPELFRKNFNIDVRVRHEVLSIDRAKQEIEVRNNDTGDVKRERYDALVLSPGSVPIRPPIPGIDLSGISLLRNLKDANQIRDMIEEKKGGYAVIVGAGAIGLETTENLVKRGMKVTLIDQFPEIMPMIDPEMAYPLQDYLISNGVNLHLGDKVVKFEGNNKNGVKSVVMESGQIFRADMVVLAMGVRPDNKLALDAGLEIGNLGGIRVNDKLQTSDAKIWAVGDAIEVKNFITGEWTLWALAGPASRQGRIAADVIFGRDSRFRGIQGSFVTRVFEETVAATGIPEKLLKGTDCNYEKVYIMRPNHAGYYPGAKTIALKLLFSKEDGKILGAQAVGRDGVDKRIDIISMAIQKGSTVYDLEESEFGYAPQYSSAKDPVNMAGMVAANILRQDNSVIHWTEIDPEEGFLLDVREPSEFNSGHPEGSVNIPLGNLRSRLDELPRDKDILVFCAFGQRSYYAARVLKQHDFSVKNVAGGWSTHKAQTETVGRSPRKFSKFSLECVG